VADVDSARMLLHIHGKRKQDRYVPLPQALLKLPTRTLVILQSTPDAVSTIPR